MTPNAGRKPLLKAHQITDTTSGKAFFLLVGLTEDTKDFEDSSINIRATDGNICWTKEGIQRQSAPKDWMKNVYSAVTGAIRNKYEIQVQSSPEQMKVSVQWHEGKVRVRASVVLPVAAAEEDALPSMLSSLFQSFAAMQEAYAELAALEASFRARADSSQAALAKLVETKETKEREMYIKFAAVMNEKKAKLRQLRDRIQELEQQAEEGPDLENGSEAGSPPRERDSVYDAETEPSAGNSSALIDDADEATQRRPAAEDDPGPSANDGPEVPMAESDGDHGIAVTRAQAEREARMAADTQPLEPEQEQDADMMSAPESAGKPEEAQPKSTPAAPPPAKSSAGTLAKRRRR